ncbi:hypothetical protein AALP_AAs57073U000100, partial [Arabis alpina]
GDSSKDDKFGSLSSDQNSLVEAGFTCALPDLFMFPDLFWT